MEEYLNWTFRICKAKKAKIYLAKNEISMRL
jgi:hypothetical protein